MAISYSLIFHHMRSSRLLLEVDHHHHRHHYHLLRHHDNHDRHQHTDGFFRLDPPDPLRQKFKNIIMKNETNIVLEDLVDFSLIKLFILWD